ncbi:MAG: mannosyltransferase family protein [Cyanobacteria bacterium P01_A01_bin.84]
MATSQLAVKKTFWTSTLFFPGVIWLCSRLLIWIVMLQLAPHLPIPAGGEPPKLGWEVFNGWDSGHYQHIAVNGYEYVDDGKEHNIAFFPLFPLMVKVMMSLGLSFEVAGTLINNGAFLIALYCVYSFVKQQYGENQAQWTTAVLAFSPGSMFAGVIYTEGLYLALSTAALQAFDNRKYGWTALWGAMASATRPTGIAMIPAFIIAAWRQRKPPIAYLSGLATATGLLLYSLYCASQFGEPLAFIHAQKAWRSSLGFDWIAWEKMLMQIFIGARNWQGNETKYFLHPLLLSLIIVLGYVLWRFRNKLGSLTVDFGFAALILLLWLIIGDPLINAVSIFGSLYLLWRLSFGSKYNQGIFYPGVTPVTTIYGFCGIGLILASGGTISLSRIAYGIVSTSIALGVFLSHRPRWGYFTIGLFSIILVCMSVRFAQGLWVG